MRRPATTASPAEGAAGFTIRPARPDEVREVAGLWCDAFPGKRTLAERVRMLETGGRYGGFETVLVARDGDQRLAGACKLYRMEQHLAGVAMPMMGLAAVAVPAFARRQGIGARLCTEAIRVAADRGDVLSTLYPFRPDYYDRLGWGLVGELHDYRSRTASLPKYDEARNVRPAGERDAGAIAACYGRVVERSNGPVSRDATGWAYRLTGEELGVRPVDGSTVWDRRADRGRAAIVYDDGDVTGYALLRFISARAVGDRRIHVRELVAETETAYRGLIGHIADQSPEWPLTRHFAREEERFGDRLTDPRPPRHRPARSLYFPTAQLARGPMLRLLNVPEALRLRRWFDAGGRPGAPTVFRIAVHDPERPENDGPWIATVTSAGTRVDAHGPHAKDEAVSAALRTGPATFARMFAGEISASDAGRLGRAEVSGDVAMLDRAFATRERFWLLDEF